MKLPSMLKVILFMCLSFSFLSFLFHILSFPCVCVCMFFFLIKFLFMFLSFAFGLFWYYHYFLYFFSQCLRILSFLNRFYFLLFFFFCFWFFEKKVFSSWTSCALYFWLNEVLIHTQFSNKIIKCYFLFYPIGT